ncbi:MAG: DNA internalization-related competence protein ComEC/Rec2 [Gammaproteobacteria bacterium]|nr:DNA internalization-related competence protein ComEC/Rec2 [Gammaproteobacteria bacterium]
MRTGALAWLCGILLLQQLPTQPALFSLIFFPVLLLGLYRARSSILRLLAWAGAGFLWALFYTLLLAPIPLANELVGKDLQVEGYVASLPEIQAEITRFKFDVVKVIVPSTAKLSHTLRLSWRLPPATVLHPGDYWRLTVRLKPPHNFHNPGGFDHQAWLYEQGIGATGYVRNATGTLRVAEAGWVYPVQCIRAVLRERIRQALAEQPYRRVVIALVLGEQAGLNGSDWRLLRTTGTAHLLAISGLHISLLAGLCFILARWGWSCSYRLTQRLAAPRAAALIALVVAVGYSALAGFSIPTQRSCVMLCLGFMALFFGRPIRASDLLALALLVLLGWDPFAVVTSGFWLSFVAVAIIFYVLVGHSHYKHSLWRNALWMQVCISVGLIPLLVMLFEQVPVYSPLVNLIAAPLVTYLIVPLLMAGTGLLFLWSSAGQTVLLAGCGLLELLWRLLGWFDQLPYATLGFPSPTWLSVVLALLGLGLMVLPRGIPARWLGLLPLLALFFPAVKLPAAREAYLTLLDVGQGLSIVVQTQQHLLVFDTGPKFSDQFNTGEAVIAPFLRHNGYSRIDRLIISHADNDHLGGAEGLSKQLAVLSVLSSVPQRLPWTVAERCEAGQAWTWDGVRFEIVHPWAVDYRNKTKENNLSCVLRISSGSHVLLLTGDIEAAAEQQLLERSRGLLAADIVVVPHHGSLTSSTAAFVQAVHPRYALFATGQFNRFGFPRAAVVERYYRVNAQLLNTANEGAIRVWLRPEVPVEAPQTYRATQQRFWHPP